VVRLKVSTVLLHRSSSPLRAVRWAPTHCRMERRIGFL
jgi:hypothetical protein